MSEVKFTKGAWVVSDYSEFDGTMRIMQGNITIAVSFGRHESQANANIIAAAPEMYELLERLSPIMQDNRYFGVRDEIEGLLAKARGES